MVWNAVESIRFNHFVVKYSIFVSVVERNHHTALIGGVQRRSIDLLNDYGIICVVKPANQFLGVLVAHDSQGLCDLRIGGVDTAGISIVGRRIHICHEGVWIIREPVAHVGGHLVVVLHEYLLHEGHQVDGIGLDLNSQFSHRALEKEYHVVINTRRGVGDCKGKRRSVLLPDAVSIGIDPAGVFQQGNCPIHVVVRGGHRSGAVGHIRWHH